MIHIQENIPLAPFTTFKIGGKARYFTEASTPGQITAALEWAEEKNAPAFMLSGGSNVLFADAGYPGLVIRLAEGGWQFTEAGFVASGAVNLGEMIEASLEKGLGGMERMSGIPGSLGGALRGNAGAFGAEIKDVVTRVKALHQKTGLLKDFTNQECAFGYRTSYFKQNPEWVVVEVAIALTPGGDAKELLRIAKETRDKREAKHPQSAKCAGSFFMNPLVKNEKLLEEFTDETGTSSKNGRLPAGWLINHCGLRGKKIGGAQISKQHPNYLVNTGSATADDVLMLASFVKTRVRNELGVQLKEEVQYVGF
jgi:UDP-N-acetylmuramate dehydrogenase